MAAMAVHRERVRKAYGCLACGRELFPEQQRYLCGTCRDEFSFCPRCYAIATSLQKKKEKKKKENQQPNKDLKRGWGRFFSSSSKFPSVLRHDHPMYLETIYWEVDPSAIGAATHLAEALMSCFSVYGPRRCLGWRQKRSDADEGCPAYEKQYSWLTYAEVHQRSLAFGQGTLSIHIFMLLCSGNTLE